MPTAPTTTVPTTDPGVDLGVEPSVNINPHPSSLKVGIIAAGIIGGLVAFIAIILVIWRFKKVRASRNRNQNEEADLPGSPLTISTVGPTSTESSGSFAIPLTPVPTNETQEPTANIAEIATARSITLRPVRPAMVSAKNEEVKPNSVAAKEGTATEGTAKEVKTDDEMARKVVTHPMISQPVVPELVPLPTSHLTNLEEPLSGQGSVEFTTTRNYDPDAETYVLPEEISGHRRRARPMSAKSLD
jgi:hypothetical protein